MTENAVWAAQIRAKEALAIGNARRLKERLDRLRMHNVRLPNDV